MCVCIRFPHKTFIYSNDLEEVARVPGRLALETGDRLSFLPSFLPSFLSDLLCLGPWVFISRRGSHGGGFRPLTPFPVHEATKPHRTIEPGLRAGIRFIAFRSSPSPIDIRFSLFLSFFFLPPLSSSGRKRRRDRWNWERSWNRKREERATTWARRIPSNAIVCAARNQSRAQGRFHRYC